jgi:hypothetical protein
MSIGCTGIALNPITQFDKFTLYTLKIKTKNKDKKRTLEKLKQKN